MLIDAIRNAPGFRLVHRGGIARETAANLYDASFVAFGQQPLRGDVPWKIKLSLASDFFVVLHHSLAELNKEILTRLELMGGARGFATMADIKNVDGNEALELFEISYAVYELGLMHEDMLELIEEFEDGGSFGIAAE